MRTGRARLPPSRDAKRDVGDTSEHGSPGGSPSQISRAPPYRQRKQLSHDVLLVDEQPTIIFITVCTKGRRAWLATNAVHDTLLRIWQEADAWLIGRYVVMPEHIHLFCAPGALELPLANWVTYWKSQFTRQHGNPLQRWQSGFWDTRLRRDESYGGKWEYVRNNPFRHGFVTHAEDWPYQGELHVLEWS
jgi:REP-associated tyrosine transposase